VKQVIGFQCPKCKSILYLTGKCSCGQLGYIKERNSRFDRLYTDTGEVLPVYCYIDDTGRLIRYTNHLGVQTAPTLFIEDEFIERI